MVHLSIEPTNPCVKPVFQLEAATACQRGRGMRQLGRGADRNGPIAQSRRLHFYAGTSQTSACASPLPRHLLHYAERGGRGPRAGPLAGRMSSGKFQIRPAEDRTDPAHLTAQSGGPVRGGPSRGPVGTRPTVWAIVRGPAFRGAGSAPPPDGRLLIVTSLLSTSLQIVNLNRYG